MSPSTDVEIPVQFEILRTDLSKQIAGWKARREDQRLGSKRSTLSIGILSATTTVVIGISSIAEAWNSLFSIAALVTSASASVLVLWESKANHRDLWIVSSESLNELYDLEFDLKNIEGTELTEDQRILRALRDRYRSALRGANQAWLSVRRQSEPKLTSTPQG